jgi:hypothetical protein
VKVLALLPLIDWLALVAFFALWIGYAWFAKFWGIRQRSLIATTNRYRGCRLLQSNPCLSICVCTPNFPSSTAPIASIEIVKAAAPPTASRRWRSPTWATCSAPSSSTRRRVARASSR